MMNAYIIILARKGDMRLLTIAGRWLCDYKGEEMISEKEKGDSVQRVPWHISIYFTQTMKISSCDHRPMVLPGTEMVIPRYFTLLDEINRKGHMSYVTHCTEWIAQKCLQVNTRWKDDYTVA